MDDLLQKAMTTPPVDTRKNPALLAWIKANRMNWRENGYTIEDVIERAVICGSFSVNGKLDVFWDMGDIALAFSHFDDAMTGRNIEQWGALEIWNELKTALETSEEIEEFLKERELDLKPLWEELVLNNVGEMDIITLEAQEKQRHIKDTIMQFERAAHGQLRTGFIIEGLMAKYKMTYQEADEALNTYIEAENLKAKRVA